MPHKRRSLDLLQQPAIKKRSASCVSIVTNDDGSSSSQQVTATTTYSKNAAASLPAILNDVDVDKPPKKELIVPLKEEISVGSLVDEEEDYKHSVALIFESGTKHFDRNNRLQRERPARIVAVETALRDAGLIDQCRVLSTNPTILTEADFASVHSPAYLKR